MTDMRDAKTLNPRGENGKSTYGDPCTEDTGLWLYLEDYERCFSRLNCDNIVTSSTICFRFMRIIQRTNNWFLQIHLSISAFPEVSGTDPRRCSWRTRVITPYGRWSHDQTGLDFSMTQIFRVVRSPCNDYEEYSGKTSFILPNVT